MLGKIAIEYWPGAEKLVKQLTAQGITINDFALVTELQKDIDAANRLFQRDYLTENELVAINNKIHGHIIDQMSLRSEP